MKWLQMGQMSFSFDLFSILLFSSDFHLFEDLIFSRFLLKHIRLRHSSKLLTWFTDIGKCILCVSLWPISCHFDHTGSYENVTRSWYSSIQNLKKKKRTIKFGHCWAPIGTKLWCFFYWASIFFWIKLKCEVKDCMRNRSQSKNRYFLEIAEMFISIETLKVASVSLSLFRPKRVRHSLIHFDYLLTFWLSSVAFLSSPTPLPSPPPPRMYTYFTLFAFKHTNETN